MLPASPVTIKPREYAGLLATFKRPVTLDVRDIDYNRDGGVVANSTHVPFYRIVANAGNVEPLRDADGCFVYCRSSAARALLSANKIKEVFPHLPTYIISGGILGLQREAPDVPIISLKS